MAVSTGKTKCGIDKTLLIDLDTGAQEVLYVNGTGILDVTLSLDTNAYADGDVLAATQEIPDALRFNGGTGIVQSLIALDKDDQGLAFDVVFLKSNVSIGAENAAVSITDTDAEQILGIVNVEAANFDDLVASQIATKVNVGIPVKSDGGTKSLYIAAISRGAGTYSAAGIVLKIGILRD